MTTTTKTTGTAPNRMPPLAWVLPLLIGVAAFVAGGVVYGGHTRTVTVTTTVTATPTEVTSTMQLITTVTATPAALNSFKDGVRHVGTDIVPGTYRTPGLLGPVCYYSILDTADTADISNSTVVTGTTQVVLPAGKYFETSGGCQWTLVSE